MRILSALLFTVLLAAAPVAAQDKTFDETLDIGISTDEISIASDFTGADITIFGAIDKADPNLLAQGKYDIVVALEGPKDNTTVLKKERVFGIWINRRSMTFELVPASYSMSSTRDVEKIAAPDILNSTGVGLNHIRLTPLGYFGDGTDLTQFRDAFRNRKEVDGLYQRDPGGVQFISSSLFKASVRLPANIPNGVHIVRAHLFRNGEFVTEKALPMRVVKTGIEEAITRAAFDKPLAYGFFAVLLAVATGWLASVVFRRD
ncbi:TIGR02186 family protein [Pararhizobium sp.]|uniref:TIGR02186 family protein n=1 Tax=Pararhizobium sp. TaxID=1977563 RepID=UPI002719D9BB|nr:TIGR02186 family protein [Pararhizobium sp.]MDO9416302.1 TIGR02186 family protein [Pararhizobium sp.]